MSDSRKHTPIHEAGHFVARERLGLYNGHVTIVADDKAGSLGHSLGEGCSICPEIARSDVIVSLAGYAALVAAGYSDEDARLGAGQDFEDATAEIEFHALGGSLDDWLVQAVELMRQPQNVVAVKILADQLLIDEHLHAEEASLVVSCADEGDDVAALLKAFRAEWGQYLWGQRLD